MALVHSSWWCCLHAWLLVFAMHLNIYRYFLPCSIWLSSYALVCCRGELVPVLSVYPVRSCIPPCFSYVFRLWQRPWMNCVQRSVTKAANQSSVSPHMLHISETYLTLASSAGLSITIHQRLRSAEMSFNFSMRQRELLRLFLLSLCFCLQAGPAKHVTPRTKSTLDFPLSFHCQSPSSSCRWFTCVFRC